MGLLDSLEGAVEQHPELSDEQHASLLQNAVQMFGHNEGISGMLSRAHSNGLGGMVESWIGNDANQSIAPDQVHAIAGQDKINELASRVGIPPAIASAALSTILPKLVDRMTSQGKLPQAA